MYYLKRLIRKLITFYRIPLREKLWLTFLYPYSGIIRAATLLLPFNQLAKLLGHHSQNVQLSSLATEEEYLRASRIGRITEITSRYTPWKSKCLVQAIMARTLLGYYGIPYVFHFGAHITGDSKESMKAHAWVKVGPRIITGRKGHKSYGIVATYTSLPLGLNE